MDRRLAIKLAGASVISKTVTNQQATATSAVDAHFAPPRLTVEELAARVKAKGFDPKSLYAHEVEFVGIVKIQREVPMLQIKGMDGAYSQVHLHGSGGNVDVGKELNIKGLIVDHGFGALMIWMREWKYADA